MLLFEDLKDRKHYKFGELYVQIVAFRPTSGSSYELDVCAYSSPEKYSGNQWAIPPQDRETVRVDGKTFTDLTTIYKDRTGQDLFSAPEVNFKESLSVDIFHSYCFVELSIRLGVGLMAFVNRVKLISEPKEAWSQLWERFCQAMASGPPLNKDLLLSVVGDGLPQEAIGPLSQLTAESTSYSSDDSKIKSETDIKSEDVSRVDSTSPGSQQLFESMLEPDPGHRPAQIPSSTQIQVSSTQMPSSQVPPRNGFLFSRPQIPSSTQIPSTQIPSTQYPSTQIPTSTQEPFTQEPRFTQDPATQDASDDEPANGTSSMEFLTQAASVPSQLDFPNGQSHARGPSYAFESSELNFLLAQPSHTLSEVYAAQEKGTVLPLKSLNKVPLAPGPRIFRTKARIVASIPQDLSLLCTKSYVSENGTVVTTDPHFRPLELILTDTHDIELTPANSLSVYVPKARILSFFGCRHTEQLYTQIEAQKPRFAQLHQISSTFDLSVDARDGMPVWTLKDVTLDKLLGTEIY